MTAPDLIQRLRDEAGLCRNETAEDVANLLEEAANALERLSSPAPKGTIYGDPEAIAAVERMRASLTASEKDAARWRLARTRIMWDRYGPSLPCGANKVDPEETDRDIDRAILAKGETK